jgi:ferredoxin
LNIEVEKGFDAEQTAREVERCLNCDVQTAFTAQKCIECDACIDVCPVHCLTITPNAEEPELRKRLTIPALNVKQDLYVSSDLPQTRRVMVKDEDLCVHCGLCAERCPTAAWDMQKFDLHLPYAGRPVPPKTLPAPGGATIAAPPAPPANAAAQKPELPIA